MVLSPALAPAPAAYPLPVEVLAAARPLGACAVRVRRSSHARSGWVAVPVVPPAAWARSARSAVASPAARGRRSSCVAPPAGPALRARRGGPPAAPRAPPAAPPSRRGLAPGRVLRARRRAARSLRLAWPVAARPGGAGLAEPAAPRSGCWPSGWAGLVSGPAARARAAGLSRSPASVRLAVEDAPVIVAPAPAVARPCAAAPRRLGLRRVVVLRGLRALPPAPSSAWRPPAEDIEAPAPPAPTRLF